MCQATLPGALPLLAHFLSEQALKQGLLSAHFIGEGTKAPEVHNSSKLIVKPGFEPSEMDLQAYAPLFLIEI